MSLFLKTDESIIDRLKASLKGKFKFTFYQDGEFEISCISRATSPGDSLLILGYIFEFASINDFQMRYTLTRAMANKSQLTFYINPSGCFKYNEYAPFYDLFIKLFGCYPYKDRYVLLRNFKHYKRIVGLQNDDNFHVSFSIAIIRLISHS